MDGMRTESGFGMTLTQDDLTLLLIAQNARFRIATRLTMKNQTGYQIRPECDLFGRRNLPTHVTDFLLRQGLPAQHRYTQTEHLTRLLRLLKPFVHFTKEPKGYSAVSAHLGSLPALRKHEDVIEALGVLDDESV